MRNIIGALSLLAVVTVASAVFCLMAEPNRVHQTQHPTEELYAEWHTDRQGLRHGEERYWDEAGALLMQIEYSHGEIIRQRTFDSNGNVKTDRREGSDYLLAPVSR